MTWEGNMEKITKAAIQHNGKIYTGYRHGNIMQDMAHEGVQGRVETQEMGFLTDTGRFVSRVEAAKIAYEAGQIPNGIYSLDSYQVFPLK